MPLPVQTKGQSGSVAVTAFPPQTFTSNNTAGNSLAIFVFNSVTAGQSVMPQIADTNNNKYQVACSIFNSTGAQMGTMFVALGIAGGPNTVNVSWGANQNFQSVLMAEYAGASAAALDYPPTQILGTATAASSTNPTSPSFTPTGANEILVSGVVSGAGTPTIAGGWTKEVNSSFGDGLADQVSVSGSYQAAWTDASAGIWEALIIALAGPAVVMTPPGGAYDQPIRVRLSNTAGSPMYYTVNGSTPTSGSTP